MIKKPIKQGISLVHVMGTDGDRRGQTGTDGDNGDNGDRNDVHAMIPREILPEICLMAA